MASFDLFKSGRPSQNFLLERFGVQPPQLYLKFCQWCFDHVDGDVSAAESLYWRLLSLESCDVDSTGYASPFELFSIGDWDGDQVGWVNLAPELQASDHPWIWYQHDGASISVLARDTPEFFSRVLSHALVQSPEQQADVTEAAQHLGVSVSEELGKAVGIFGSSICYERNEPAPRLHVDVPEGWRYVSSESAHEGVGVLAPSGAFAPGPHADNPRDDPLQVAADLGNRGHPASALWHLLTPRARHGANYHDLWIRHVKQAYTNLGRPQLAARVGQFDA